MKNFICFLFVIFIFLGGFSSLVLSVAMQNRPDLEVKMKNKNVQPIFNPSGQPAGWLTGKSCFDLKGTRVAIISNEYLLNLKGEIKGYFKSGFFCDPQGNPMAFLKTAQGGPALPKLQEPTHHPTLHMSQIQLPEASQTKASKLLPEWSSQNWEKFLSDLN